MSTSLEKAVHQLACSGFTGAGKREEKTSELLQTFQKCGSTIWVDTGDKTAAEPLWTNECNALTTNNTLANQVVQTGVMDKEILTAIRELKEEFPKLDRQSLIREIGFIVNCKIALGLVERFGVRVSVELHPAVACDYEATLTLARRYYAVNPDYFIIKIPLTPEGYLAVRTLAKEGIPINYTLGFSARQNYLAAAFSRPRYLNVFLGRLNAVVQDHQSGTGEDVGETVTWATQHALAELKKDDPSIPTELIAASIRNGEQVFKLAGIDVLTIPPKALKQALESGKNRTEITSGENLLKAPGIDDPAPFTHLWEVDDAFKAFTTKLCNTAPETMSGEELLQECEKAGINLFTRFTSEQKEKISRDGKIPNLPEWDSTIAIDDLMTQSALLSFTNDQKALDERIEGFL